MIRTMFARLAAATENDRDEKGAETMTARDRIAFDWLSDWLSNPVKAKV